MGDEGKREWELADFRPGDGHVHECGGGGGFGPCDCIDHLYAVAARLNEQLAAANRALGSEVLRASRYEDRALRAEVKLAEQEPLMRPVPSDRPPTVVLCSACEGRGTEWAGCGCGRGVKHVADCGKRPPVCAVCGGKGTVPAPGAQVSDVVDLEREAVLDEQVQYQLGCGHRGVWTNLSKWRGGLLPAPKVGEHYPCGMCTSAIPQGRGGTLHDVSARIVWTNVEGFGKQPMAYRPEPEAVPLDGRPVPSGWELRPISALRASMLDPAFVLTPPMGDSIPVRLFCPSLKRGTQYARPGEFEPLALCEQCLCVARAHLIVTEGVSACVLTEGGHLPGVSCECGPVTEPLEPPAARADAQPLDSSIAAVLEGLADGVERIAQLAKALQPLVETGWFKQGFTGGGGGTRPPAGGGGA